MERWNPWRALRARPHVTLQWAMLRSARGLWVPNGATATIYLDVRLSRRERRCVLAHELVHDERGIAYGPGTPRALVDLEERAVTAIAVERLVPATELEQLANRGPIEMWEVADHFDVDQPTALHACRALAARRAA